MARFSAARFLVYGTALAVTLIGCGGDGGPGAPAAVATTITVSPSPVAVQSGNAVTLSAVVRDQNGVVMTGQTVTWSSSNNDKATVSPSGVVNGKVAGTALITASIGAVSSTPTTVTITAGLAATLTKVAELPATMPAGSSDSVRVTVRDSHSNPTPGVTVTFAVSGTGSTLSSTTATTNAAGYAAVGVTLGSSAGQITTVTASVAGLTPVSFTTTSTEAARVATTITISPNPTASVQAGSTLQMSAVVRDQFGDVMTGQSVTWAASNTRVTITSGGLVSGVTTGVVTISASMGSLTSNLVQVTVTAGAAAQLNKVGDLAATMAAGTSDSVRVRAVDALGNGVAGVTVTFAVSGAGSTISTTSRITDANGYAGVLLTVSTTPGQQATVTATASGLNTLTFVTNTVTGPPARLQITSPRVVVIDQGGTTTLTTSMTDAAGNPISTATGVNYISRTTSVASVSSSGVVTGLAAGQSIIVAQSAAVPSVRDSMLVVVAVPGGVVVLTDLMRFDLKADTTFTVGIFVDMRSSGEKLGSTRLQLTWNPATLIYQSDAEGAAGVGATVNSSTAVAGGVLTLAVANATGFAGNVEVRRITFRASATTGRTTALVLGASELNGISPAFTDLKPKTIAVTHPIITR